MPAFLSFVLLSRPRRALALACFLALVAATASSFARPKAPEPAPLTETGRRLESGYAERLARLRAEIESALPKFDPAAVAAHREIEAARVQAQAAAEAARKALEAVAAAQGLVDHAKGKWIGGADKDIAAAEAALAKAGTEAERAAAGAQLAKARANRAEGVKALAEREAAFRRLKSEEPSLRAASDAAKAALDKAVLAEAASARSLLGSAAAVLADGRIDDRLLPAAVLADATPRGLAAYAQQGSAQAASVDALLADLPLMREMLHAGGAKFGQWGRAAEILEAIRRASPRAREGVLRRLALAVALEHARPIPRNNVAAQVDAPAVVDPVGRYLHYEQAYLAGELDPAFPGLGVWELRMAVNSDVPDEILAWGRRMLRAYRPDIATLPDAGWRYVMLVRTDVRYGSQNVKDDIPALHQHQNIPLNGGVCGRRAFFGRFLLRAHGVPTWGVTQKGHAALSHWTPKGWVVNLGAGFHMSWWDQDEVVMGGSQFLRETQARAHGEAYLRVLRAQWVSRVLGEKAHNERARVEGGFWSNLARLQTVLLASAAVDLGPLGQELGEANEAPGQAPLPKGPAVTPADRQVAVRDGALVIPAVAGERASGQAAAMRSHGGGAQLHCSPGYKAAYAVEVPDAGRYRLTARVATLQANQAFRVSVGGEAPLGVPVPHTVGLWGETAPVELTLSAGRNLIHLELPVGNRGVTLKELTLSRR